MSRSTGIWIDSNDRKVYAGDPFDRCEATCPPPSPNSITPRVISEMFIKIDVTLPATLLRKTGEPQAAFCLNIER